MSKFKENKRYVLSIILLVVIILISTNGSGGGILLPFDEQDVDYIELDLGWPASDVIVIDEREDIESVVDGLRNNFSNKGFELNLYFKHFFMKSRWPYTRVFTFYLSNGTTFVFDFDTVHTEEAEMYANVLRCTGEVSSTEQEKSSQFFAKGTFPRDMYRQFEDEILEVYPDYPHPYL